MRLLSKTWCALHRCMYRRQLSFKLRQGRHRRPRRYPVASRSLFVRFSRAPSHYRGQRASQSRKSDVRNHCATVQPWSYGCAMVTVVVRLRNGYAHHS